MTDGSDSEDVSIPPWERKNIPVPKPTVSDYGYLDGRTAVPCTEAELVERCGDRDRPIGNVWVPEHDRIVTVFEAPCLFEKIRGLEMRFARGNAVKSLGISIVGVVIWTQVDTELKIMVLLMTAIFGVVPTMQNVWQLRSLATLTPESMAKWPASMRYQSWISGQSARVTNIILGGLVVVFIGQLLAGLNHSIYLGGLNRAAVRVGEYWRAVTATLLHGGTMHILFNGMALFYLGRPVEVLAGPFTLVVVLVVSMLTGAMLSLLTMPAGISSVGASGGIIGLLGFLIVFGFRYRRIVPSGFTKNLLANVVFIACLGLALSSMIDNGAHLGGLLGGALCGALFIPAGSARIPMVQTGLIRVLGWVSIAYLAAAAGFTLFRLSSAWEW